MVFLSPGSPRSSRTFHLVQLGHPEKLRAPAEHLRRSLEEHGLKLTGTELSPTDAKAGPMEHQTAMGALNKPR